MKLHQLKSIVAIYEEGSISAGAARVNATQSGLSMQIRDLEQRHGVTLFQRSSSGIRPTETGRRFYVKAVDVLRAAWEAEEELRRSRGALTGTVRVGLMPTFTRALLPKVLLRFSES